MAEAVRKRRRSALQLSKYPFDGVAISAATRLKSESGSLQCGLEVLSAIDEKDGVFDVVFLSQFTEEDLGQSGRSRRKELDMKQVVRFGVCGVHKSEALVQPIRTALPF